MYKAGESGDLRDARVRDGVLELIGDAPMVRLSRLKGAERAEIIACAPKAPQAADRKCYR